MDLNTDSMAVLIISLLEAVAGMVTSFFIFFYIIQNIFKGQTISTRDKILLALSVSNMASAIILSTSNACEVFSLSLDDYINFLRCTLILYCTSSCSWLTACLCFFYYIKIMHFQSKYLSELKKNIDVLVPWTILVVEVISLCGSFVNIMMESLSINIFGNIATPTNISDEVLSEKSIPDVMYVSNFVSYPLIIVTTTCIMASVTMHIRRMKKNISTSETINLEAHERVIRTMQHLVAFYVVFYLLLLIDYLIDLPGIWNIYTNSIILLTFSPLQSIILINGNPRLKESWYRMWQSS